MIRSIPFTTPTIFDHYNEFADACSIPQGTIGKAPELKLLQLCARLVNEKWIEETAPALDKYAQHPSIENFAEVADGIIDTVYVLCQLARVLGVPFNAIWEEVHSANMRKVGPDGKVLRREDGKILKPEGWQPPAVWDICYAEYTKEMQKQNGKALGD